MNQKIAKQLRRLALFITGVSKPTNYKVVSSPVEWRGVMAGGHLQVIVNPVCTRGVYLNLKRQARDEQLTYAQLIAKQRVL